MDTAGVNLVNWRADPFTATEIDSLVYGRGSMDMKGVLSIILSTIVYFASHRDEFNGRIMADFVVDEEGLSQGTYQLVSERAIQADYAIMAECRYDEFGIDRMSKIVNQFIRARRDFSE